MLNFRRIVSHFVHSYGFVQMDKTTSASSPRFNYIRDVELVAAWRRQQSGIPLGIRNRPDFKINYTELGGESAV